MTYNPDATRQFFNPAMSNIPGLSQQLPQKVDTFGNPITKPGTFIDVMLSPSQRSLYKPTPEAQLVVDLLQQTGDTRVAPRAVQKYLTGKDKATGEQRKVDLTPEQYVRLQTLVGQESARLISRINPNLPTEKKVQKVIEALDKAGQKGRNLIKAEVGLRKSK